jgi:hypothetical protein
MSSAQTNFKLLVLYRAVTVCTTAGLGYSEVGWNARAQVPSQAVSLWPHFEGYGHSE